MRLDRRGCPGNKRSVGHFLCSFFRTGPVCMKMGCCGENGLLCRTHYARIYIPEWIAVDCSSYSHSKFNLSALKAHLRKSSFANLLCPRPGPLYCSREREAYKCCRFSVICWFFWMPVDFLILYFKKRAMNTLSCPTCKISTFVWNI